MRDLRFSLEKQKLGADFYASKDIVAQPAIIRIEEELVDGLGTYSFDIKKAAKSVTERTINYNDLFMVDGLLVALLIEKDDRKGASPLLTYPLVQGDNLPAHIKGFTTGDAFALYGGDLIIKNDASIIYRQYPMVHFLDIPKAQPKLIVNAAGDGYVADGSVPEFNIFDKVVPVTEKLAFAGNHNIEINVSSIIAQASSFAVSAGYTSKIVFLATGWILTGAANDKYKVDGNPLAPLI